MNDGIQWLTERQACDYVGRSVHALRTWRRTGDLPFSKQPGAGRIMVRRDDLDRAKQLNRERYEARKCGRPRKGSI